MGEKVRLGFIGVGTMGCDLIKETLKNPKGVVAALCDPDAEALAKAQAHLDRPVPAFADPQAMLEAGGLDGVVVASPGHLHAQHTIAALEAGFHTFCEKPMALNVNECEAMIAAANRAGKGLMIGQVLRYIGPYRYVLELAQSRDLGRPIAMRVIRTMGRWGNWQRPWRLRQDSCGGTLFEVNVHEIDLMLCILGQPTSVSGAGGKFVNDEIDYEDFITATITFAGGAVGSVTSAACDWLGKNSGEIYFEQGTVYYESMTKQVVVARDGRDREVVAYQDIGKEWETGPYREMREFCEACLGEHPVTISGEDGMRAVEVCEAAYRSAREGRPLSLPLPRLHVS